MFPWELNRFVGSVLGFSLWLSKTKRDRSVTTRFQQHGAHQKNSFTCRLGVLESYSPVLQKGFLLPYYINYIFQYQGEKEVLVDIPQWFNTVGTEIFKR